MKRSEFEALRRSIWDARQSGVGLGVMELVERDVQAAECAGVTWDPEDEDLPHEIVCGPRPNSNLFGLFPASIQGPYGEWASRDAEIAGYRDAVRRWNAWPKLREKVEVLAGVACPAQRLAASVLAILDGGKEPSNG